MKTLLLLTIFALLSPLAWSQVSKPISIGQIDSLQSTILKEKRTLWVHVPQSYQLDHARRYPVVYLLDGEDHFSTLVGMLDHLSGTDMCPEMVVVGILNTDRMRDLTPTPGGGLVPSPMDSVLLKNSGGGETFTAFIEQELRPHIDSVYPTQPYRVLIGHSLGGLLVINTLVHHPNLFNAYVAIDPSVWWAQRTLLNQTQAQLAHQHYAGKTLFLGIANSVMRGPEVDTLQIQADTSSFTNHIRSILLLNRMVKANPQNGLRYREQYYGHDNHATVTLIAQYDALRFIFDYYALSLTRQEMRDPSIGLADRYAAHYATISKHLGYRVLPPQERVGGMASYSASLGHYQKAEALFKLNLSNFPQSSQAYEAYGNYLVARKDTAQALLQYQKALSLNENAATRKKLLALQAPIPSGQPPANQPKK